MANNISIPITDHNAGPCTLSYAVRYRLAASDNWTNLQPQFDSPIIIEVLEDDTAYVVEITRNCCNGLQSNPTTVNVTTTKRTTPTGFSATPGDTQVTLAWDVDGSVDNYVVDRATDAAFTVDFANVYNAFPPTNPANILDTGLTNGVTYYYRVKSQKAGFIDSDYAYANATPA